MRLPLLSKWKSEMPGQSRHTLPDSYRHLVPIPASCAAAKRSYSITSSARPSSGSGTVSPSALAVLRFMISSTFVDC
jgi:hypothetical protein